MDIISSESQLIVNNMEELGPKNEETIEISDNCDQNITIQLELGSNVTNIGSNSLSNNSFGSLLIPGYLLVKSSVESSTFQLQQTVMAINVDSDQNFNNNNIDTIENIDLSQITSCIDIPDIETQTSINGSLDHILLTTNSNDISFNNNVITGVTTRSKAKKCIEINSNKKKTKSKTKDNFVLNNCEKVISIYNKNNETIDKKKLINNESVVEEKNKTTIKENESEIMEQKTEKKLPPSRLVRVNCPVCNKEFKKTYLKEHMKIHEEDKPYKCLTCGKTYRFSIIHTINYFL
jgi:DNA-directed RNA polymerase subunit M/transcription elongation factor TFIIS